MCIIEIIDITSTVGNVVATVAEIQNVKKEKAAGEYQTEVLISQAKTAEKNAAYERQEGIEKARRQKLNAILNMSEEKANIAASNLGLNSQTSLNLIDDEKLNGELDALTTIKDSEKRADSYMETAKNYYDNAVLNSYKTQASYNRGIYKSFFNTNERLSSMRDNETLLKAGNWAKTKISNWRAK